MGDVFRCVSPRLKPALVPPLRLQCGQRGQRARGNVKVKVLPCPGTDHTLAAP